MNRNSASTPPTFPEPPRLLRCLFHLPHEGSRLPVAQGLLQLRKFTAAPAIHRFPIIHTPTAALQNDYFTVPLHYRILGIPQSSSCPTVPQHVQPPLQRPRCGCGSRRGKRRPVRTRSTAAIAPPGKMDLYSIR